jgi:hypothetical protein
MMAGFKVCGIMVGFKFVTVCVLSLSRGRLAWKSASLESWCPQGRKGSNPFPGANNIFQEFFGGFDLVLVLVFFLSRYDS